MFHAHGNCINYCAHFHSYDTYVKLIIIHGNECCAGFGVCQTNLVQLYTTFLFVWVTNCMRSSGVSSLCCSSNVQFFRRLWSYTRAEFPQSRCLSKSFLCFVLLCYHFSGQTIPLWGNQAETISMPNFCSCFHIVVSSSQDGIGPGHIGSRGSGVCCWVVRKMLGFIWITCNIFKWIWNIDELYQRKIELCFKRSIIHYLKGLKTLNRPNFYRSLQCSKGSAIILAEFFLLGNGKI